METLGGTEVETAAPRWVAVSRAGVAPAGSPRPG